MAVINKITVINPRTFVGVYGAWNILNSTKVHIFFLIFRGTPCIWACTYSKTVPAPD